MSIYVTPDDCLMLLGTAVSLIAFCLMFLGRA
jgi:hypothetical protein